MSKPGSPTTIPKGRRRNQGGIAARYRAMRSLIPLGMDVKKNVQKDANVS